MDATQKNELAAANLKALRSQWGLSRDRVVSMLEERGISLHVNSLRRIEEGVQPLKLQESIAFADIYGMTISDLIDSPLEWPETVFASIIRGGETDLEEIANAAGKLAYTIKFAHSNLNELAEDHSENGYYRDLESRLQPWLEVAIKVMESLNGFDLDLNYLRQMISEIGEIRNGSR
ncbi:MAG: hypothetical protein L0L74_03660 [Corynebacterium casei]|nr:hypothetical protein [Corynebacterium casei]